MHRTSTNVEHILFSERLDEPGVARTLVISMVDYADMGWPEVITVTIEPGDLLNS
jgi:hypothetical protein